MSDALFWHRLQFAFTITYHYLFPQLTMGLALLIVVFKAIALRTRRRALARRRRASGPGSSGSTSPSASSPASRWSSSSAPTGRASRDFAGGVIGQTLAMEGMFAFFLESAFLGLFLFGEKRLGPRGHLVAALALFARLAGCRATSSSPPTPSCSTRSGYAVGADGDAAPRRLLGATCSTPGRSWQYAHNMMRRGGHRRRSSWRPSARSTLLRRRTASTRALFLPRRRHRRAGRQPAGRCSRPATGRARWSREHQPVDARRDGRAVRERRRRRARASSASRTSQQRAARQPDRRARDAQLPRLRQRSAATVHGLNDFPQDQWPRQHRAALLRATTSWSGSGRSSSPSMGARGVPAAGGARSIDRAPHALGADARVPVPLHREHRRLDDRRAGPPAVARLRPDAHRRRHTRRTVNARQRRSSPLLGFWASTSCSASLFLVLVAHARSTRGPAGASRGVEDDASWRRSGSRSSSVHARGLRRARRLRLRRGHRSTCSSRGPTTSGGTCSPRSARSGTATRSG